MIRLKDSDSIPFNKSPTMRSNKLNTSVGMY